MSPGELEALLRAVQAGSLAPKDAAERLRALPLRDLGHTKLDTDRELRCGFPEVIFAEGKTATQVVEIARTLAESHGRFLATRLDAGQGAALREVLPEVEVCERARVATLGLPEDGAGEGRVAVLSAGTADEPAALEAALTARMLGARVERIPDVGVAGLHRLVAELPQVREAKVLVVAAGMEGALPSVVAGLVERPVIALPTSVGYGASFGGLAALLAMLNSCAAGVTVVNVDNGFGAGYAAATINRL